MKKIKQNTPNSSCVKIDQLQMEFESRSSERKSCNLQGCTGLWAKWSSFQYVQHNNKSAGIYIRWSPDPLSKNICWLCGAAGSRPIFSFINTLNMIKKRLPSTLIQADSSKSQSSKEFNSKRFCLFFVFFYAVFCHPRRFCLKKKELKRIDI